jgi:lysozyme family protein
MKTKNQENNKYELHIKDVEWLRKISSELEDISDNGSISEHTLKRLANAANEIDEIADKMLWKIINLLKNNTILEEV